VVWVRFFLFNIIKNLKYYFYKDVTLSVSGLLECSSKNLSPTTRHYVKVFLTNMIPILTCLIAAIYYFIKARIKIKTPVARRKYVYR